MPRIPDYESQITPAVGSVQPGSSWLPNISRDTGAAALFAGLGAAGKTLEKEGAREIGLAVHEQRVLQQGKAVADYYLEQAKIEQKHSTNNNPDMPQTYLEDLQNAKNKIVEGVDPRFQKYIDVHLDQLLSHDWRYGVRQYGQRIEALQKADMMASIQTTANTAARAWVDGNLEKYAAAEANLTGFVNQVQGKIPGIAKKSGGVEEWARGQIKDGIRGILLAENPQKLQQMMQTQEGKEALGITPANQATVQNHVMTAIHDQQKAVWDEIQKGFVQNKIPTPEQLSKLSGHQQLMAKHLIESVGNKDNHQAVLNYGKAVIELKSDPDPANVAEGKRLINEIYASPNLSTDKKLNFIDILQQKINGTQTNSGKFYDDYLMTFSRIMTPEQHKLFLAQYTMDPKGMASISADAPLKDKTAHANAYAIPYINRSIEILQNKGKKGVMQNLSGAGAEVNQPPISAQTYRAFNKRTGQYENVTKEQYDMIKGAR